jgi:hypothetical protein
MTLWRSKSGSNPCVIELDDTNRAVALAGLITPGNRNDNPPASINGFVTDGTPFDKGHIHSCENGGPDPEARNIVPQYRYWQQTGTWRQMEVAVLESHKNQYFTCRLFYPDPDPGITQYQAQCTRFENSERVFDWVDRRIPSRFEVMVIKANGSQLCKYVTPKGDDFDLSKLLDGWLKGGTGKEVVLYRKTLDHSQMPNEDRMQWLSADVREFVEPLRQKNPDLDELRDILEIPRGEDKVKHPVTGMEIEVKHIAEAANESPLFALLCNVTNSATQTHLRKKKTSNGSAMYREDEIKQVSPHFIAKTSYGGAKGTIPKNQLKLAKKRLKEKPKLHSQVSDIDEHGRKTSRYENELDRLIDEPKAKKQKTT